MELTVDEIRAALMAVWHECVSLTRSERAQELLPPGANRLAVLRTLLERMMHEIGRDLSEEERYAAGLGSSFWMELPLSRVEEVRAAIQRGGTLLINGSIYSVVEGVVQRGEQERPCFRAKLSPIAQAVAQRE